MHDFNGFNDWLHSFSLYRGKKTSEDDDDDHRIVGKFKVRMVAIKPLYSTLSSRPDLKILMPINGT